MLAAAIAVLTPVHFVVSCGESSAVAAAALGLLAATFFLCLKTPEGTIGRFDPLAFAFGACILNILALH
jgi:hypothetical protein